MNKGINASLLAMVTVLLMVLLVTPAMAYDHDQTYNANATYFVLEDIIAPGHCNNTTVAVWLNTSDGVGVNTGTVVFNYTYCCANVTSVTMNDAEWDMSTNVILQPGRVSLGFGAKAASIRYATKTKIADLVIHCCNGSSSTAACCGTNLEWDTAASEIFWVNTSGFGQGALPNVNLANGTYLCGETINVTKKVWKDGSGWVDYQQLDSSYNGTDVKFNITVKANCLDLSNVEVSDTMDPGLLFNDTSPPPWSVGALAAGESWSIEFNATIVGYGPQDNIATANATVDEVSGIGVQASDTATVDTMAPAGFDVNKTVWDASIGAWVGMINVTMANDPAQDTYRFRCEIENTGSPGMNICDMVVTDVLPANLVYADNAKLQDHHGAMWNLPDPPDINDSVNKTYGWIINNTVPGECLQPLQKIVVEYDVTVVNYGLGCNEMTADGWCNESLTWVDENDSACINVALPDLNVSKITVNYDVPYLCDMAFGPTNHTGARTQCNNLSALIVNNGAAVVPNHDFNVTFVVTHTSSGEVVANCTVPNLTLAAGANMTVCCNCKWYPYALENYIIDVTVDPADNVIEADEGNNTLLRDIMPYIYGWKGDSHQDGRNITMLQTHTGPVNLVYSKGDSTYKGSTALKTAQGIYLANWAAFPIPATNTTIKKARLYVYYNWDKTAGGSVSDNFTMKFNGYTLPRDEVYIDQKMPVQPGICCPVLPDYYYQQYPTATSYYTVCGSNYPYGMAAYDVTHKFKVGDTNSVNLTSEFFVWDGGLTSINGMLLVVVYDNPDEPERAIWINEGYDMLDSGLTSYAKVGGSYIKGPMGITPEEATTYAPFTGAIGSDNGKASLTTVVMSGTTGDANSNDKGQSLYFNDQLIGEDYVWGGSVAINEANIPLDMLSAADNTAAFRSYGDGFNPTNAFLIVEKGSGAMSVEPDSDECYDVGEQFDVLINITPMGVPIRGAQFDLHYNKDAISVLTLAVGDFLEPPVSITHSDIDNGAGVASFAASMTSGTNDGMTEPGTFAIVHCMAVGQGATSQLDLTDALAYDNSTPIMLDVPIDTHNDSVEVCDNAPPVPVAMSNYTYNNMADKILSKAHFNSIGSYDPDGSITIYEWWFGDGRTGVGPAPEHDFKVRQYWVSGAYVPANVTLVVTDDGMPLMDNMTHIDVKVWIGGDANGDGRVNIGDAVMVGYYWGSDCNTNADGLRWYDNPPADMADLNNDERVNIGDTIPVGFCWGHTAW